MTPDESPIEPEPSDAPPNTTRILHCSDLHAGHGFLSDRAERLVEAAHELKPDAVVVSGDLTMRARPSQFRLIKEILMQLPHPLLVIPGNHDIPLYNVMGRLLNPFRNFGVHIGLADTTVLQVPGVSICALNTINPFRHQKGRVTRRQLAEVERIVSDFPADDWRVVVTHQQFAVPRGIMHIGAIANADTVMYHLARSGIHAVLHGHIHVRFARPARDFFPGVERNLVIVSAGTATSSRVRHPEGEGNSFNLLEFSSKKLDVHTYAWCRNEHLFRLVDTHEFLRSEIEGAAQTA